MALATKSLKRVSGVQCGLVKASWRVGTLYNKKWFVTHSQRSALLTADARRLSGSRKIQLLKSAQEWKRKATELQKKCDSLNGSQVAVTTTMNSPTTTLLSSTTTSSPATTPSSTLSTLQPRTFRLNFDNASTVAILKSPVVSLGVKKASVGSNLKAIRDDGTVFDPIEGGTLEVRRLFTAPGGNIYVLLKSPFEIEGGLCILFNVTRDRSSPRCVERDKDFIISKDLVIRGLPNLAADLVERIVQFDSSGAIYYSGSTKRSLIGTPDYFAGWSERPTVYENYTDELVIRRWKDGVTTDFGYAAGKDKATSQPELVDVTGLNFAEAAPGTRVVSGLQPTRSRYVKNWTVTPNGHIVVNQFLGYLNQKLPWDDSIANAGHTLDVYSPSGEKRQLLNTEATFNGAVDGTWANSFNLLTSIEAGKIIFDCSIYARTDIGGICEIDTTAWTISPRRYGNWATDCRADGFANRIKPKYERWWNSICFDGATQWIRHWKTPSGRVFALAGGRSRCLYSGDVFRTPQNTTCLADFGTDEYADMNSVGIVVEVLPRFESTPLGGVRPEDTNKVLENVEVLAPFGDSVVAAGPAVLSDNGRVPSSFKTVIMNLETGASRDLLPANLGLRVTNLSISESANRVFFSATRLSDQTQMVGSIQIASGVVSEIEEIGAGIDVLVPLGPTATTPGRP